MIASELRVGNLVSSESGEIFDITPTNIRLLHHNNKTPIYPIPLTPEILEKCGFAGAKTAWCKIDIGKWPVGDNGFNNLVLGRCGSEDGLPYAPCIEQYSDQGFTIKDAAKIQEQDGIDDDEAFLLKKKSFVVLPPIKHLHQLQNLYFALTGQELEISL